MAEHLLKNWSNCIQQLEAYTATPVRGIPLLSTEERHQLLYGFNDTKRISPEDRTILGMFDARVEMHPNAIALVYEDNRMSYAQLNSEVNRLTNYMRARHVIQPDDVIGVLLPKSDGALIIRGALNCFSPGIKNCCGN